MKKVWAFGPLCGKSANRTVLPRNYFGSVWDQLLALNMTWYWSYTISVKKLRETLTDMPWRTWDRLVQKNKWLLPTERPDCYRPFRRPLIGGDTLSPLAPAP